MEKYKNIMPFFLLIILVLAWIFILSPKREYTLKFDDVEKVYTDDYRLVKKYNSKVYNLINNLKLEKAHVEKMQMQFLYKENDNYVFMNTNDYSQMEVSSSIIGDDAKFLKEGLVIEIQMYEGEILGIVLPEKIDYKVTETTDAVKGNTTNNAMKDATIESGYTIKVPMFISEGETIIVSTKDGKYVSRA